MPILEYRKSLSLETFVSENMLNDKIAKKMFEGFLSPSNLPTFIKYGTEILTGIAIYSYLLLVSREKPVN